MFIIMKCSDVVEIFIFCNICLRIMFREIVIVDAKVKNLILKSFNPGIYEFDKRYDIGL